MAETTEENQGLRLYPKTGRMTNPGVTVCTPGGKRPFHPLSALSAAPTHAWL